MMIKNILCFGDSNTWGMNGQAGKRFNEETRWTALLQRQLGSEFNIIEAGEPNRTLVRHPPFNGINKGITYLKPYLQAQPISLIVIMLGTNDLKNKYGYSAQDILQGLATLIEKIEGFYFEQTQFSLPKILFLSLAPIQPVNQFKKIYQGFAEKQTQLPRLFFDLLTQKKHDYVQIDPEIKVCDSDGIHLTPHGHTVLSKQLCEIIKYI
ncbi:hypothetical protein J8L70_11265 [Pseudoalteromonas sp. MMG010]|uniref:SGNH/GDSL hydrolase family protein n=1 Tax=Pseudoalteromonas sp. MMG010 TaxID=2822685 RepID=UPI001B3A3F6F|nr:SGNH/GDSL hydrolase family protein [Pseudoalteromonas sp. MMG010]MBQ4833821.1 hypothetical protein [Pseudoalteromonas sp. MMG010]